MSQLRYYTLTGESFSTFRRCTNLILGSFRIAKTGTRSIIYLLLRLSNNLGFQLDVPAFRKEILQDNEGGIMKEIKNILNDQKDGYVRTRHYSYIDFKQHGTNWSPIWFSMVRDPVERVILFR